MANKPVSGWVFYTCKFYMCIFALVTLKKALKYKYKMFHFLKRHAKKCYTKPNIIPGNIQLTKHASNKLPWNRPWKLALKYQWAELGKCFWAINSQMWQRV